MTKTDKIIAWLIPVIMIAMTVLYRSIDPTESVFIPKCPWWLLTGTYCPSCGIQRFLHLLLCGDIIGAFRMNPFLGISIPYAALAVLGKWYNYHHLLDPVNRIIYSRPVLMCYVAFFFIWWIVRNLLHV